MHDVCVSRSVCTYDSTYLDACQLDVHMMTYISTRCIWDVSAISTSSDDLEQYESIWMMMRVSTRFNENDDISRLENCRSSRLDLSGFSDFFCPVCWQISMFMLRSLSPQHPDTFYPHYLQILDRLPNHIIYCFIFKKPFFN